MIGALVALFVPNPAQAAVQCTWNSDTEIVEIEITGNDSVTIRRTVGGALDVVTNPALPDPTCGGATMTHIGEIHVSVQDDTTTSPADQTVTIDLVNGLFEPGNDLEAVNSNPEIEFEINLGPHTVGGADKLVVKGGAGADDIRVGAGGINFNAGEGAPDNDFDMLTNVEVIELQGQGGADTLRGDGGAGTTGPAELPLTIAGGAGTDVLTGGNKADTFDEGASNSDADVIEGGNDTDTVKYPRGSTDPVSVSIDNAPNDGSTGENDNVDVENITGGAGNDTLSGTTPPPTGQTAAPGIHSSVNNVFSGAGGNDTVTYADREDALTITIGGTARPTGTTGSEDTIGVGVPIDVENVVGGKSGDTITGNGSVNVIDGGPGNDPTLDGQGEDDTIRGGPGIDFLKGGADEDTLFGGPGDDTLDGEADGAAAGTNDKVDYSGAGALVVSLTAGTATGEGSDSLTGIEEVVGSELDDKITGSAAAETLRGGGGNDTLIGAGGNDALHGDGGTDTVTYTYTGFAGPVTIDLRGANHATGDGNDTLATIEMVIGSAGADTFKGSAGADDFNAAGGNDTVDFSGLTTTAVSVNLTTETSTGDGADKLVDFEHVTGGGASDVIVGDADKNTLTGGGGNDTITGLDEDDTIAGGAGNDVLSGGNGNDGVTAAAGDDTVEGGPGNDTLDGGSEPATTTNPTPPGSDTVTYAGATAGVSVNLSVSTTQNTGGAGNDTLSNFEHLTGSNHDDPSLRGTTAENTISGLDGDDVINGDLGDDTFIGGAGIDRMSAGGGDDHAVYSDAPNAVVVDLSSSPQTATGHGNDTLAGIVHATGSNYNDTITGDAVGNELTGGKGDDLLIGSEGADTLDGGDGADTLRSGSAPSLATEALLGGNGSDTADYSTSSGPMVISLAAPAGNTGDANGDTYNGVENVTGSSGNDTITGRDSENNRLSGLGGVDSIKGGSGDDTLDGGAGDDTLDGEVGNDTVDFSSSAGPIAVDLDIESPTTQTTGAGNDQLIRIENATGSSGNDTLKGDENANVLTGGDGDDTLTGRAGNDTLVGGGHGITGDTVDYSAAAVNVVIDLAQSGAQTTGVGDDTIATTENAVGSPQHDTLSGNGDANTLTGGNGNDIVNGRAGNDVLLGGGGVNTLAYAGVAGGVSVDLNVVSPASQNTGGGGADTISGFQNLTGSSFDDTLTGTVADNVIDGGGHATAGDTVSFAPATSAVIVDLTITAAQPTGGGGNDTLLNLENVIGSAANDVITASNGDNVLDGGTGIDKLSYAAATTGVVVNLGDTSAQATVGSGTDTISGFENVDGSNGDDGLTGDGGPNVLNGGDGDDYLDGAGGDDTENGGAGNDRFFQGTAPNGGDGLNGGSGDDLVDYSQRSVRASVTRDGIANDGEAGEGDNVGADVEDDNVVAVAPSAPQSVAATAGNRSATVTWAAPASDGGQPITGYRVTASPGGATASTAGDQRSAVVGNLTNGTTYTFTVVATNDRGTGPASAASNAVMPKAADGTTGTQGYTMVDAGGAVYNFGATSKFFGSMAGHALNAPIIGLAHTPTGKGYWLVARDGGIFSFGDARFFGSMGGISLNAPVLGMEPTPSGNGYWLFAGDGGIFSFGDATFFGSMGGKPLNQPVVGMSSTSSGKGYWLVASDGGIFSFGDARFFGSMGGKPLNEPVFDIAGGAGDNGYYLVARDGGIFAFGNIEFYGSAAPSNPSTVVGIGATPTGKGYWIADDRGMVFRFGDAEPLGDRGASVKNPPVTGFAAVPKPR